MSNPHKIVLLGFSPFERATFESFFRLAARRAPGYLLVSDATLADLAVVNSDDPATLRSVTANKPCRQVMLVGNSDGGTGWSLQKRPLNLMKVLSNVEQLLGGPPPTTSLAAASRPSPLAVAPAVVAAVTAARPAVTAAAVPARAPAASGFAPTQSFVPSQFVGRSALPLAAVPAPAPPHARSSHATAPVPAPAPTAANQLTAQQRNSIRVGTADFANSRADSPVLGAATRPQEMGDSANMDHIMVVDDSDIALKFMRNRLTRFGFRADLVSSGEEALGRLNMRPYKFVFLDVMMEGLDGYQTCRAIKQRKYTEGKPPVVVMLTSRGGTIDKIRGTLAGCDAYLTKPLNERDLIAVLAKHDRSVARGFQETNFGASAKSGFDAVR